MSDTVESFRVDEPPELIREQSYLVSRGVRCLALVGSCPSDEISVITAMSEMRRYGESPALPFVIDNSNGYASYGYASASWVIDLLKWTTESNIPIEQNARITGLLLGYNSEAIRVFEENQAGRIISLSAHLASKRQILCK